VQAVDIAHAMNRTAFTVLRNGVEMGRLELGVPGLHNVRNALGASVVAMELGIPFGLIAEALASFTGAFRRFEVKADIDGILIVDDYAHHPTEVRETLLGIRAGWKRRIVTVFQPHTYTRTRDFVKDFGGSFMNADVLIVTDVYPAREKPIQGITGDIIVQAARLFGHKDTRYVPDKKDVPAILADIVQPGDIVITMGAGDIYQYGMQFITLLKERSVRAVN
jgi:UDP-N-acetylmuramate--alanine ligase